jgi:single-stranded-DNA-specific exonuclease
MKKWQVLPKIEDKYIRMYPTYDGYVLQLLKNRHITEKAEIDRFLEPDLKRDVSDPFVFKQMNKTVELIIKHIKTKNKILVFGDYDADGVTATALMSEILTTLKANVDVYIPNRVSEGYGLNKDAVNKIAQDGFKLIITVDNGIRSQEEINLAKELGLEVVVTDHHQPPDDESKLPDCLIINPVLKHEKYPNKHLAGVGVAWQVARALISRSKLEDSDKALLADRMLDLVAIGTVADCVPLLGENRTLVQAGIKRLEATTRLGLIELMNIARINNHKKLEAWSIGFQIGPRLNAAGRVKTKPKQFLTLQSGRFPLQRRILY